MVLKNILLDKEGSSIVVSSKGYFNDIRYVIPTLGYASKVDEDLLWSEIEDRVPKKKKKEGFYFGLGLGCFWQF